MKDWGVSEFDQAFEDGIEEGKRQAAVPANPRMFLLWMFDRTAQWPEIRAAIRLTLKPEEGVTSTSEPLPSKENPL